MFVQQCDRRMAKRRRRSTSYELGATRIETGRNVLGIEKRGCTRPRIQISYWNSDYEFGEEILRWAVRVSQLLSSCLQTDVMICFTVCKAPIRARFSLFLRVRVESSTAQASSSRHWSSLYLLEYVLEFCLHGSSEDVMIRKFINSSLIRWVDEDYRPLTETFGEGDKLCDMAKQSRKLCGNFGVRWRFERELGTQTKNNHDVRVSNVETGRPWPAYIRSIVCCTLWIYRVNAQYSRRSTDPTFL